MTDLVKQLVGALDRLLNSDPDGAIATASEDDLTLAANDMEADPVIREQAASVLQARAALTAAKAGGWVAVPGAVYEDDGVSLIRRGTEDERCRTRGSVRLYAHLPNPPKEQSAGGLGSVDAVADPLSPT